MGSTLQSVFETLLSLVCIMGLAVVFDSQGIALFWLGPLSFPIILGVVLIGSLTGWGIWPRK